MPTKQYSGRLSDIGLDLLTGLRPVVRVRPEAEAFSADGLISSVPKTLTLTDGSAFTVSLVPSGELTNAKTREPGVDYIIEVGRFEDAIDGTRFHGTDAFRFTATAGGGNIGEMAGGSLLAVWLGPNWPPLPSPPGLYIDTTPPNLWGVRS